MTSRHLSYILVFLIAGAIISCGSRNYIGHALRGDLPLPITTFDEASAESGRSNISDGEMAWTDFQLNGVQTCSYSGEQSAFELVTKIDGNAHYIIFNYIVPLCIGDFDESKYMLIFVVPYNAVGNLQLPSSFFVFNMEGKKIVSYGEKEFDALGISVEVVNMTEDLQKFILENVNELEEAGALDEYNEMLASLENVGAPVFAVRSVEFSEDLVLADEGNELLRIQAGSSIRFY